MKWVLLIDPVVCSQLRSDVWL